MNDTGMNDSGMNDTGLSTRLSTLLLQWAWPLLVATSLSGQTQLTENTLKAAPDAPPVVANIDELSWLAGSWRGEGLGGTVEEIWSAPSAGVIMGGFQLNRDGAPSFFEFLLIGSGEAGLVLRLKHFNPDFSGWEEKADFVSFPLVKLEPKAAYFRGLTYRRVGDELLVFLAMRQGETLQEVPFVMKRVED